MFFKVVAIRLQQNSTHIVANKKRQNICEINYAKDLKIKPDDSTNNEMNNNHAESMHSINNCYLLF